MINSDAVKFENRLQLQLMAILESFDGQLKVCSQLIRGELFSSSIKDKTKLYKKLSGFTSRKMHFQMYVFILECFTIYVLLSVHQRKSTYFTCLSFS